VIKFGLVGNVVGTISMFNLGSKKSFDSQSLKYSWVLSKARCALGTINKIIVF
jgi:hypothetical protein